MGLRPQYVVVGGILAAFVLYFGVNAVVDASRRKPPQAAPSAAAPTVQATLISPVMRPDEVPVRARTQAARVVSVRAQTSGIVAATPVREGSFVRAGEVLCRLQVDARQASLDQARANLRSKQLTEKASADLAAKGYRSPTQVLTDQANLDEASATVRSAEIALEQVNIRAPFAGVFDTREVEVGAYLSPGGACGTVIELDPLKIIGDVPESEIAKVRVGARAHVVLASGQTMEGVVYYVARDADAQTRTYPVVVAARNPGSLVRSGLSAQVQIAAGAGPAFLAPSSALVLDAAGRQGVRYVGADGRVAFAPVTVVDETPSGVWLTGLSGPTRVIIVGQSYVSEGQLVRVASR